VATTLSSSSACSASCFSTAPHRQTKNIFELPPNLKIDPRVTSSPFYGAERVNGESRKKEKALPSAKAAEVKDDNIQPLSSVENLDPDEESVDDYSQEDEDEERVLYNLSTVAKPKFSIPLPHRLHVNIHNLATSDAIGTFHLSPQTFGLSPVRVDILHRVVVWQRNKKRGKRNAGARTKTVSEVSGSGRKVRRQKGSGKSRAGHSRPAHWRGGAKAHGPKGAVTDYTTKLNKKVRKLGVRHALSQKLLEGNLVILGDMNLETHKTRRLEEMLAKFGVGKYGSSALFIDEAEDATADYNDGESDGGNGSGMVYGGLNVNFKVASGNLHKIKVLNQLGCNVYDMLKFEKLFLTLSAVRALEERLEKDLR
jgi:large subunit ribosomal protein L4